MATIEVNPHRRSIIQMRAQCNHWPGARSQEILRLWADRAGLNIGV